MMKIVCLALISVLSTISSAQEPLSSIADLDALYGHLKKTPSYKSQVKGEKKKDFENLYLQLKAEFSASTNSLDQFETLTKLLAPLHDNHLSMSGVPMRTLLLNEFYNTDAVKLYRNSPAFLNHPRTDLDIDSLELFLARMPADSVEGIYYHTDSLKVGLFRTTENRNRLVGVVLDTKLVNWDLGQVVMVLNEYSPNRFSAIYYHPIAKVLSFVKSEKFMHGSLTESNFYSSITNSVWKKFPGKKDFVNIPPTVPTYVFRNINERIQYLRLGSFNASDRFLEDSKKLYDRIKDSITAEFLILDLRNNWGGGFKSSRKFVNLVKSFAKKKKVYVMINNRTFSNAEQFVIELMGKKNITLLGETTNGTLTYGSNYGRHTKLPSGKFQVYLTDMKGRAVDLKYEGTGIAPDVILKPDTEWIQQVVELLTRG